MGEPFLDLNHTRDELWRQVCDLDSAMRGLKGLIAAGEGLAAHLHEQADDDGTGPTAGLLEVIRRMRDEHTELEAAHHLLAGAALVIRENDPRLVAADRIRTRHVVDDGGEG
jgi:hypothetical protein